MVLLLLLPVFAKSTPAPKVYATTPKPLSPQDQCRRRLVLLLWLHCLVAVPPWRCCCGGAAVLLLLWLCRLGGAAVVVLLWLRCLGPPSFVLRLRLAPSRAPAKNNRRHVDLRQLTHLGLYAIFMISIICSGICKCVFLIIQVSRSVDCLGSDRPGGPPSRGCPRASSGRRRYYHYYYY